MRQWISEEVGEDDNKQVDLWGTTLDGNNTQSTSIMAQYVNAHSNSHNIHQQQTALPGSSPLQRSIDQYRKLACLPFTTPSDMRDSLKWWSELGEQTFPKLALLARSYLALPASTRPSKVVFPKRHAQPCPFPASSADSEKLDILYFNIPLVDFQY